MEENVRFCPFCNGIILRTDEYCAGCGKKIDWTIAPSPLAPKIEESRAEDKTIIHKPLPQKPQALSRPPVQDKPAQTLEETKDVTFESSHKPLIPPELQPVLFNLEDEPEPEPSGSKTRRTDSKAAPQAPSPPMTGSQFSGSSQITRPPHSPPVLDKTTAKAEPPSPTPPLSKPVGKGQSIETLFETAENHLGMDDKTEALKLYKLIVKRDPTHAGALARITQLTQPKPGIKSTASKMSMMLYLLLALAVIAGGIVGGYFIVDRLTTKPVPQGFEDVGFRTAAPVPPTPVPSSPDEQLNVIIPYEGEEPTPLAEQEPMSEDLEPEPEETGEAAGSPIPEVASDSGEFAQSLSPTPELAIPDLVQLAAQLVTANNLTTPKNHNAWDVYGRILKQEPTNAEALAGKDAIITKYIAWARSACVSNRPEKYHQYLTTLTRLAPKNDTRVTELVELCTAKLRQFAENPKTKQLLEQAQNAVRSQEFRTALTLIDEVKKQDSNSVEAMKLREAIKLKLLAFSDREELDIPYLAITARNHLIRYDNELRIPEGLIVQKVMPGGPSSKKLQYLDLISEWDGKPITSIEAVIEELINAKPITKNLSLGLKRAGAKTTVSITTETTDKLSELDSYRKLFEENLQKLSLENQHKKTVAWFREESDSSCIPAVVQVIATSPNKGIRERLCSMLEHKTFPEHLVLNQLLQQMDKSAVRTPAFSACRKCCEERLPSKPVPATASALKTYFAKWRREAPTLEEPKLLVMLELLNEEDIAILLDDVLAVIADTAQKERVRIAAAETAMEISDSSDTVKRTIREVSNELPAGTLKKTLADLVQ